jgi:HAD superfamily hydrolase (TIGR01549 family)
MSKFKAIFFDLGSTLVYSKDPWPPIYEKADQALIEVLRSAGFKVDPLAFYTEFGGFIRSYYEDPSEDNHEKTAFISLREMLFHLGFQNIPDSILRAALVAMYAVTQKNWYLEDDAIPTLKILGSRGYRLGLISNTSDEKNVQGIVDHWELRPFFESIITSAELGVRKPDARIFQTALDRLKVLPQAAVMVGDTLEADVLGANRMNIFSIWITRRAQVPDEGELVIQPQAVITALDQIPDLLADVENDRAKGIT